MRDIIDTILHVLNVFKEAVNTEVDEMLQYRFLEVLFGVIGVLFILRFLTFNALSETLYRVGDVEEGYSRRVNLRWAFICATVIIILGFNDYRVTLLYLGMYLAYELVDLPYRRGMKQGVKGDKGE